MSEPTPDPTPPSDPMARLEQALRDVGSDASPPPGWESRVRAAVAESTPRRSWWWFALPSFGGLAAAVAGWALLIRQVPAAAQRLAVNVAVSHRPQGDVMMSEDEFRRGDVVTIDATPGGTHRRILVYVGTVPQPDACTTPPPCALTLRLIGPYTVLAMSSDRALPEPAGDFDTDQRAALDAGAQTAVKQFDVQ